MKLAYEFSSVWKEAEPRLIEIIPLMCIVTIRASICFLNPEFPQSAQLEVDAMGDDLMAAA